MKAFKTTEISLTLNKTHSDSTVENIAEKTNWMLTQIKHLDIFNSLK